MTFSENAYTSAFPGSPWGWIKRGTEKNININNDSNNISNAFKRGNTIILVFKKIDKARIRSK